MFQRNPKWQAVLALSVSLLLTACGGGQVSETSAVPGTSETNESDQAGAQEGFYLGEPRDDIERYLGVYGDPNEPDNPRGQFFVAEAKRPKYAEQAPEIPPGYLAIGAMWGDVAPMSMKSLSETKFEQVDLSDFASPEPNVAEFELGPDGNAAALAFTSGGFSEYGRRVRVGDLPAEWQ